MMISPQDTPIRDRLELLYRQPTRPSIGQQARQWLRQAGRVVVAALTSDRNEPRISQFFDLEGHAFWRVYDPLTQYRATFASEAEVREWLARRYSE
ncbi:MAG TPA: hypothetical protein V6D02_12820 [Candidatus Obscuribacterales bacterium]